MSKNEEIFFSTKEVDIYTNKQVTDLFKIKLKNHSEYFYKNQIIYNSIKKTKLLTGLTTNTFFNEITFQANSVTTLKEYEKKIKSKWSYEKCQIFISYLIKQLIELLNNKYSFYGYSPNSIIVVNENIFFQISTEYLLPISKNEILINFPFSKTFFLSPEIIEITNIPVKMNYKCIYYSIAAITTYLLVNKNICQMNTNSEMNYNIEDILIAIKGTKLYWFLLRALNLNIEKRSLIYI